MMIIRNCFIELNCYLITSDLKIRSGTNDRNSFLQKAFKLRRLSISRSIYSNFVRYRYHSSIRTRNKFKCNTWAITVVGTDNGSDLWQGLTSMSAVSTVIGTKSITTLLGRIKLITNTIQNRYLFVVCLIGLTIQYLFVPKTIHT